MASNLLRRPHATAGGEQHAHLGLARAIAGSRRSSTSVHDHEDTVQDAAVGLLQGLRTYHPERGGLMSHLRTRMHGEISDGRRRLDPVPRSLRRTERCAEEARRVLEVELGRSPSEREVAERAEVPLRDLRCDLRPATSLDVESRSGDCAGDPRVETIASPAPTPEEAAFASEDKERVSHEVSKLEPREQFVLRGYWVLDCEQGELGAVLGVSSSRISQVHRAALDKLRTALEE